VVAEMRYDLVTEQLYSCPQTLEINTAEYNMLFENCVEIARRITIINNYVKQPGRMILNQLIYYLNNVGTPTALRLADDFKKNVIYYADGSFWTKIWLDF
jgi:hypothetical protein